MSKEIKTTYTDSALTDLIKKFFSTFKDDEGNYKYLDIIDSLGDKSSFLVNTLDFPRSNIDEANELYNLLCDNPHKVINSSYHASSQIHAQRFPDSNKKIFVMFDESFYKEKIIDTLGNKFIGKLVTTDGMVTSMSHKFQMADKLFFECPDGHITIIKQKMSTDMKIPVVCDNPSCKHRDFEDITSQHPDASFEQYRLLSIRSHNEFSLSEDELELLIFNDLVDCVSIGDIVRVTGIIQPIQFSKKNISLTMYKTRMICSYIENVNEVDYTISEDDENYFQEFIQKENFYTRLINSISPNIFGMSDIKESILLQRVGGYFPEKENSEKTREHFNIGVWGSGGMAKSALGIWCEKNLPKTKIVQSRGATAKGLLLGLEDSPHGGKSVRAGALVVCQNGGTVILDEYTRLPSEVRDELMSTMESGYANIAKSGHIAKARADAGIYATGNAFEGKWDKQSTLLENLHMTPPELQRFDYHWIVLDEHDPNFDEKVADVILNDVTYEPDVKPLPVDVIIKYIEYVKRFKPTMTPETTKYLKNTYLKLRSSNHSENTSPRILNTLVRTATTIARIHQRSIVEESDIDKTISLIKKMLAQQGISIDEADTYLTRQFNKVIQVLHDDKLFPNGMTVEQIMTRLHNGSLEEIQQLKIDLGEKMKIQDNRKLRELFDKVKKSRYVMVIQHKPLTLLYKKESGSMDSWT